MDNFFRHCQKFDGSPATDIEMVKLLKVRGVRHKMCDFFYSSLRQHLDKEIAFHVDESLKPNRKWFILTYTQSSSLNAQNVCRLCPSSDHICNLSEQSRLSLEGHIREL